MSTWRENQERLAENIARMLGQIPHPAISRPYVRVDGDELADLLYTPVDATPERSPAPSTVPWYDANGVI